MRAEFTHSPAPMSDTDCPDIEKENHSASEPTLVDLFSNEIVDPVYQTKAHVLNRAIQEIGMGRYQVSCK
jgi:hypothetical protein